MLILRLGVFSIPCGDKVLENAGLVAQEQERADSGKTSSKKCRHIQQEQSVMSYTDDKDEGEYVKEYEKHAGAGPDHQGHKRKIRN